MTQKAQVVVWWGRVTKCDDKGEGKRGGGEGGRDPPSSCMTQRPMTCDRERRQRCSERAVGCKVGAQVVNEQTTATLLAAPSSESIASKCKLCGSIVATGDQKVRCQVGRVAIKSSGAHAHSCVLSRQKTQRKQRASCCLELDPPHTPTPTRKRTHAHAYTQEPHTHSHARVMTDTNQAIQNVCA